MVIFCLHFWDLRNMGGTELSLAEIQHWRWECVKKTKIKHTHPSPQYRETSYPLLYREDLVLMNEGSLMLESDIYHFYTEQLQSCCWNQHVLHFFVYNALINLWRDNLWVNYFSFPASSLEMPVRGYQWCLPAWSGPTTRLHLSGSTWQPWWQTVLLARRPAELPDWCCWSSRLCRCLSPGSSELWWAPRDAFLLPDTRILAQGKKPSITCRDPKNCTLRATGRQQKNEPGVSWLCNQEVTALPEETGELLSECHGCATKLGTSGLKLNGQRGETRLKEGTLW